MPHTQTHPFIRRCEKELCTRYEAPLHIRPLCEGDVENENENGFSTRQRRY